MTLYVYWHARLQHFPPNGGRGTCRTSWSRSVGGCFAFFFVCLFFFHIHPPEPIVSSRNCDSYATAAYVFGTIVVVSITRLADIRLHCTSVVDTTIKIITTTVNAYRALKNISAPSLSSNRWRGTVLC